MLSASIRFSVPGSPISTTGCSDNAYRLAFRIHSCMAVDFCRISSNCTKGGKARPCAYVFAALMADVLDHMEWKCGHRVDGFSASVQSVILTLCFGLSSGVFNLLLSASGYVAPVLAGGEAIAATQNAATQNVITGCFFGVEIVTGIIVIGLLLFLNVEKIIAKEQAEIKARNQKIKEREPWKSLH